MPSSSTRTSRKRHPRTQEPTAELNPVASAAASHGLDEQWLGNLMLTGDVTDLTPEAQATVLVAMAVHVGLDPLERPFMLMKDGKRTVIYARAACADALCRERGIDTQLDEVEEREIAGTSQIFAKATASLIDLPRFERLVDAGMNTEVAATFARRSKTAVGAVSVQQPETKWNGKYKEVIGWREPNPTEASNLIMKATTKAERRAVLKLVGLGGVVDESELETMDPAGNGVAYDVTIDVERTGRQAAATGDDLQDLVDSSEPLDSDDEG